MVGEAYHKIKIAIVSCAAEKLHFIIELVHGIRIPYGWLFLGT